MGVDLARPGSVKGALGVFDGMVGEMENAFERAARQDRR
jgi:hypothetical protein